MSDLRYFSEAGVEIDPLQLRPTAVEVDLNQLAENYHAIASAVAPAGVMAVVKANAYGHGLVPVGRTLAQIGAAYLAVAFVEEAIALRQAGVQTPILVFGGFLAEQIPLFLHHQLTMTASSVEKLRQIDEAATTTGQTALVHLKFDTGMGRVGVQYATAATLLDAVAECPHCQIEGIYSHLATADEADLSFTRLQGERFQAILAQYDQRGYSPLRFRHLANSAAACRLPDLRLDLVRAGILLYGINPTPGIPCPAAVKPALRWRSKVVYFKVQPADHPVSYGATWRSEAPARVVTVPVGYGDGYFRSISERGMVLINGRRYPIAGRVCMDQFMVHIGSDSAFNGDEVVLLGRSPDGGEITAAELAEWAGTIPYEILTNINGRVPRIYLQTTDLSLQTKEMSEGEEQPFGGDIGGRRSEV